MSTYRKLHGRAIQAVTTDPTETVAEGQIWYNTASDTFKSIVSTSAWVSATPLPETNSNAGGTGTQAAALFFGGRSGGAQKSLTLEYNGSGYSSGGAMGTARNQMGPAGTQTAALAATGVIEGPSVCPTQSEEYNGTSWTAGGSVSTARFLSGSAGTQTASVITGGRLGPGTYTNVTEEYNGSSWTSGGVLNKSVTLGGTTTGSLTAAVAFGGVGPSTPEAINDVTFYDGTSWSEVNNTPIGIKNGGSGGPQTSALYFGGTNPPGNTNVATTVLFDGTNFSTSANMGSSIYIQAPAANAANNKTALSMGGYVGGGSYTALTEEFTSSANVITAAAWASGGTYPTNIYGAAGAGNTPAGLAFGGYNGSGGVTTTSEYDGSTWTGGGALPVAKRYLTGFGTQTAALSAKGRVPTGSPSEVNTSEEYDGSSWTSGGTASVAASLLSGSGTQTSGLVFGGTTPPYTNSTEEYNGSSWTTGGNLGTAKANVSGTIGGTQTAALAFFGDDGSTPLPTNTEAYDGTSWSEQNNVPAGRFAGGGAGTQTDAYGFGGYTSPGVPNQTTSTINYNGTSWASQPSMATARAYNSGSAGTAPAGIFTIGDFPVANATEEFIGETTALNVKTLTQS